jgi:hypothetical protein
MSPEKYKLRLTLTAPMGRAKILRLSEAFVWDSEADALACQALLKKAVGTARGVTSTIEFVRFTEEKPL